MKKHLFLSAAVLSVFIGLFSSCGEDVSSSADAKGRIAPVVGVESDLIEAEIVPRSLSVPNITVNDLFFRVTSADGSFSREWPSFKDFSADEMFPIGDYTVEVGYADPKAEGLKCTPAYYAATDIKVLENKTVPVQLTATRTHAYVTVNFSDAVKAYFRRVGVDVKSASGKHTTFTHSPSYTETATACIVPGEAVIMLDLEKKNGIKGDNLQIAKFVAEARNHYNVNLDVNEGEVGSATLTVSFDDNTDQRHVEIDLSDEMLTTPAPELAIEGVENGGTLEFVEGCYAGDPVKVIINARGDIASVNLDTHSAYLYDVCSWPLSIDLVNAPDDDRDHMKNVGLDCKGIWSDPNREPSRMGYIDFTEVLNNINYLEQDPDHNNECSFEVTITDGNGKMPEAPVSFKAKINKLQFDLSNPSNIKLLDTELSFDLTFNGGDPADRIEFAVLKDDLGTGAYYDPVSVKSITKLDQKDNCYRVTLKNIPQTGNQVNIRAQYKEHQSVLIVDRTGVIVSTTDNDVFATRAYITLTPVNVDQAEIATPTFILKSENNKELKATKQTDNVYLVEGLSCNDKTQVLNQLTAKVSNPDIQFTSVEFFTEVADHSLDSGFDEWKPTQKGTYQFLWSVNPSDKWATLNELTTSTSGTSEITDYAYKATSGTIPANSRSTQSSASGGLVGTSDHSDGNTAGEASIHNDRAYKGSKNAALIRTVGWGSGNTAHYGTSSNQGFGTCQNMTPGELYLGKCVNNAADYGVPFTSRPSGLEFYYCYQTVSANNGDFGSVEVYVLDEDENKDKPLFHSVEHLTGSSISGSSVSYEKFYLPFNYSLGAKKAVKILITFKSSANTIALKKDTKFWTTPGGNNRSGGEYVGSELYIDDVKLIY